jgi:malonyl CoA-acyl carrier protein transacylase
MFPGQPVAFSDLSVVDAGFESICDRCEDLTGFNPMKIAISSEISNSVQLQLFGVCASLDHLSRIIKQVGPPDLLCGHSMGIYPALVAGGSIDADAALELTWRIGSCLMEMGRHCEYALGSVIGLPLEPLAGIVDHVGAHIANYNTSRHFLLAGTRDQVSAALIEAEAKGAFSVSSFHCDAPLHTPSIREVAVQLEIIVADYTFREPCIQLLESFKQTVLTGSRISEYLMEELCQPVYWDRTYRQLRALGGSRFFEVGCGTSLTKFNRWIDSEP